MGNKSFNLSNFVEQLILRKKEFTLGCDAELAVGKVLSINTKVITPHTIRPAHVKMGVKGDPVYFFSFKTQKDEEIHVFIERDGVQPEFTLTPMQLFQPFEELAYSYKQALVGCVTKLDDVTPEHIKPLAGLAAYQIPESRIRRVLKDNLYDPLERGCQPSYNAWLDQVNMIPGDILVSNKYGAGLHWHIGHPLFNGLAEETAAFKRELIKILDIQLGLPTLFMDPDRNRRNNGYGLAGDHRLKANYGMEYRVGSSYLFAGNIEAYEYTMQQIQTSVDMWLARVTYDTEKIYEEVAACINHYDTDLARVVMDEFGVPLPPHMEK